MFSKKISRKKKMVVLGVLLLLLPSFFLIWYLFGGVTDPYSTDILSEEQEIHGIKFPEGTICGYWKGKLEHVTFSRAQVILEREYVKGDIIYFDRKGNIESFVKEVEKDTVIQGVKLVKGNSPNFYPSGKLMAAFLPEAQEIQGVKFPKGTLVEFYESGELETAMVSQDCQIRGKECSKGTEIIFDKSGKVRKFRFPKKWG